MDFLLEEILEKLTPQFGVLTSSEVESVAETADNNDYFLELRLAGDALPVTIGSIQEGYVSGKQAVADRPDFFRLTIRTSIKNGLFQRINFGDLFADTIVYELQTDLSLNDEVEEGESIGSIPADPAGHHLLKLQFFNSQGVSLRPSFLLRTLGLLQGFYQNLVVKAFDNHADTAFFIADYVPFLQGEKGKKRLYRLLKRALQDEYSAFKKKFPDPSPANLREEYEKILRPPIQGNTSAAIASGYSDAVENSPDQRVYYFVEDLSLHFVAMATEDYAIDIGKIKDSDEFSDLVKGTAFQVAVNSPIYSIGVCENPSGLSRGFEYGKAMINDVLPESMEAKTLVKGKFKPRSESLITGDCPPTVDRFYFAQQNTGNFVFDYKSMKDLPEQETDTFDFAVEHLVGIFKDGLRIGAGHEIFPDPEKTEPDVLYQLDPNDHIIDQHGRTRMGIPIVATTEVNGRLFFVVVVKPDERIFFYQPDKRIYELSLTPERVKRRLEETYQADGPYTDQWEPIVAFLRDLGVIHAFALDGDDSAALIYKDGSEDPDDFLKVTPGLKKDGSMPFAVTFTKADANLYLSLLNILQTGQLFRDDFLDLVEKSGVTAAQQLELISKANNRILLPFDASQVSSPYGERTPPVYGASAFHLGLDFGVSKGTPVTCVKEGKVHLIYTSPSFGLVAILYHGTDPYGNKYFSFYAHLDSTTVQVGETVPGGSEIGASGDSGSLRIGELLGFDIRVTPPDFTLQAENDYLTFFRNRPFSRDPQQFMWPDLTQV